MSTTPAAAVAPRPAIAELYELWTLDVILSIGPYCGTAFEAQPQRFKNVPSPKARLLAEIKYKSGMDEYHLSDEQRTSLIEPILGASDGRPPAPRSTAFHLAANSVRKSAAAFVERSFDTGVIQLRSAFRDSASAFHAYMKSMSGAVVDAAEQRIRSQSNNVIAVLQDQQFAAGFGLQPAPSGGSWPFDLEVDGDGASLVTALVHAKNPAIRFTEDNFLTMQRIAHFGATTMEAIANQPLSSDQKAADEAIGSAYRWWTAVRDLEA